MKHWAWVVAALYCLILALLTVPVGWVAFAPQADFAKGLSIYIMWPYWVWLAVMFASQLTLLSVPARALSGRPTSRGPLWRTILVCGLMASSLVVGAFLSLFEFVYRDKGDAGWTAITVGLLSWAAWALIFSRLRHRAEPTSFVSRQCHWLFKGSILELLIAVPTHVVARYRNYCCAGLMTFVGLATGLSVMLFSFGPAVYFLYAERWKRLHAQMPSAPGGV